MSRKLQLLRPPRKAQSGQAIVLIALMMVGLMGVLGMAIDGGGLYFLHRDTQNAVDAALVAALYAKCAGNRSLDQAAFFSSIETAGKQAAERNGFVNGVNGVMVQIEPNYRPPSTTQENYVRVIIRAPKPSYFIQLVYPQPLEVTSSGVGYCQPTGTNLIPNAAFVSIRPTSECSNGQGGGGKYALSAAGGATMDIIGGIFINSSGCSGDTDGKGYIDVEGGCAMVGGIGKDSSLVCDSQMTPKPAQLTDYHPLSDRPRPQCPAGPGGDFTGGTISPGTYNTVSGNTTFQRGVYCINSIDTKNATMRGDGIVIYMPPGNGGVIGHAQADVQLKAPTKDNCVNSPSTGNTCDFVGLLIWSDVANPLGIQPGDTLNGEIHLNARQNVTWEGMIYAPGSLCTLEGQGKINIIGQLVCWGARGQGGSGYTITWRQPDFLLTPPKVSITE